MAFTKEQLARYGITVEQDEVSDEEAHKLIEDRFSSLSEETKKQKKLIDTRNSEIAEFKRKEQEKLSDDEKEKLRVDTIEKENQALKRTIARSNKVNEYMGIGYSKELAEEIADAELDGKPTVALHKKHMDAELEKQKAELLKGNPTPQVKDDTNTWTQEKFDKAGYEEKLKLHNEHPELYEQFSKKN